MTQVLNFVERIEIVFDQSGTIKVIQVNDALSIDGVVRQITPVSASSITDARVQAILSACSLATVVERDALRTDLLNVTKQRDACIEANAQLTAQLQVNSETANQQIEMLIAEKAAVLEEKETLAAEVARLTALVPAPLSPREIYPRELFQRLTMAECIAAFRSADDNATYAVVNLFTTISPVQLDSVEVHQMMGALVLAGILTPERMAEIFA